MSRVGILRNTRSEAIRAGLLKSCNRKKLCKQCGKGFRPTHPVQVFCCRRCCARAYQSSRHDLSIASVRSLKPSAVGQYGTRCPICGERVTFDSRDGTTFQVCPRHGEHIIPIVRRSRAALYPQRRDLERRLSQEVRSDCKKIAKGSTVGHGNPDRLGTIKVGKYDQ